MNCCSKCFKDFEIKGIIESKGDKGNCNFCNSEDEFVYNIIENIEIKEKFEELLNIYTADEMKIYPSEKSELLKNILFSQWNIFNLKAEEIYIFLKKLLPEKYEKNPDLFNKAVGLKKSMDVDYIEKNSILKKFQWNDFVKEIKFENRFHSDIFNKDIFRIVLECNIKNYKKGTRFYRARISDSSKGFKKEEMGAPPPDKISGGRINSQGISCLYLANSEKTAIHEVRAGFYDHVVVAEFELLEDIKVINLAEIDKNSPFQTENMEMLAINLFHLKEIANEMSKPLRKNAGILEYLPTQYISDFIKKEGFSGIEYKSVMEKKGINLAVFDENFFQCKELKTYTITELNYEY